MEKIVSVFFQETANALASQKKIRIPGIGLMKADERKAYVGRNPSTGASIEIPVKTRIQLKTSPAFKHFLDKKLKKQQDIELQKYKEEKEKAKLIPFDKGLKPEPEEQSDKIKSDLNVPKTSVAQNMNGSMGESDMLPGSEMNHEEQASFFNEDFKAAQEIVDPIDVHAGNGAFEKEFTIREIADQTARKVQNKMLIVFGSGALAVIILVFVVFFSYFNSTSFYHFIKSSVNKVNEENNLTYEQIDMLVMERMKELRLDMSQMNDLYKQELYSLQDVAQKKINDKIRADVKKEMKKLNSGIRSGWKKSNTGNPYIKIVRYKVRKGDNLWKIAESKSKNPYNWVGIYQTNGRKIRNPHLIYPGQEILIPIIIEKVQVKKNIKR